MFNDPTFYNQCLALAEGKIKCECGNDDWRQFLYAGTIPDQTLGACKRCGRSYLHKNSRWTAGPLFSVKA